MIRQGWLSRWIASCRLRFHRDPQSTSCRRDFRSAHFAARLFRHGLEAQATTACLLGLLCLSGCQQADDDDGPEFSVTTAEQTPQDEPKKPKLPNELPEIELTGRKEPPREGELKFALRPGAKFPLQKTVDQTLVQQAKDSKVVSRSRLFTRFAITVDAEEPGKRRMSVRYDRVRYSHDLLGDKVEYDSASPGEQIPDAALLYHGMVNNGFSFWLSSENLVVDIEGMQEFLQRCARFVPPDKRQQAVQQVLSNTQDESFSNFVDDSIGLLRFNKAAPGREAQIKEGDEWSRSRKLTSPVPMALDTTYRLVELNDKTAKIDVFGTIVPMRVAPLSTTGQRPTESQLILKDGHTAGVCVIDRETGLPIHSRVERSMGLHVKLANSQPIEQHKRVITTVESFPSSGTIYTGQDERKPTGTSDIQPVGLEAPANRSTPNQSAGTR